MRPDWLAHGVPRQEFSHYGVKVQHRRTVDRIELGYIQAGSLDADDPADRAAQPIRPIPGPLREDPDCRPFGVVAGMARPGDDVGLRHLTEQEQHLDVREGLQPYHRVR